VRLAERSVFGPRSSTTYPGTTGPACLIVKDGWPDCKSQPDRGIVRVRNTTLNRDSQTVMMAVINMIDVASQR
jgi:hypothetical protein